MSRTTTRRAGWHTIAITTTALAVGSAGAAASGAQPPGPLGRTSSTAAGRTVRAAQLVRRA